MKTITKKQPTTTIKMTQEQKINTICKEIMDPQGKYMSYIQDNISIKHSDDLLQEILLILLDKPKKMIQAYDEKWLRYLFVNISSKQYFSSSSPFYKKYRQHFSEISDGMSSGNNDDIEYKMDMEDKWHMLKVAIEKTDFTWYETNLMEHYFDKNLSYQKVEDALEVDSVSVWMTIQKCLGKIKHNLPEGLEFAPKRNNKKK